MDTHYWRMPSPVGELLLLVEADGLREIRFANDRRQVPHGAREDRGALRHAAEQLEQYFAGERRAFDLTLAPRGTAFQHAVWNALLEIPYGQVVAYSDIAARIGKPAAVRAVGLANGRNPIPIVIPCHRVLGRDGALTGYGGGLPIKRHLLALEGVAMSGATNLQLF